MKLWLYASLESTHCTPPYILNMGLVGAGGDIYLAFNVPLVTGGHLCMIKIVP